MALSSNIQIIPRDNPLILEVKISPDTTYKDMPAVSPKSLVDLRVIIVNVLSTRHYKHFIIDLDGLLVGASGLLAKLLMCYEKASIVNCKVCTINVHPRMAAQHMLAKLDSLIPFYTVEQTPKPEEYNEFFGYDKNISFTQIDKFWKQQIDDNTINTDNLLSENHTTTTEVNNPLNIDSNTTEKNTLQQKDTTENLLSSDNPTTEVDKPPSIDSDL